MKQKLILGPPGTGKTTRLLQLLEHEVERVGDVTRIAFVSFTRKATQEAAERIERNLKLDKKQMRYFRTIHSLCYRELGVASGGLLKYSDYEILGKALGVEFSKYGYNMEEGIPAGSKSGDRLLHISTFARSR